MNMTEIWKSDDGIDGIFVTSCMKYLKKVNVTAQNMMLIYIHILIYFLSCTV